MQRFLCATSRASRDVHRDSAACTGINRVRALVGTLLAICTRGSRRPLSRVICPNEYIDYPIM